MQKNHSSQFCLSAVQTMQILHLAGFDKFPLGVEHRSGNAAVDRKGRAILNH